MTDPIDDLLASMPPPASGGHALTAGMGDPGGPARYGQGVIRDWDPDTFENTVEYRGALLVNVPVMGGPDALTYTPGDVVALMSFAPQGGAAAYWIAGRIIVPGTGAAEQQIAFMTGTLGRAIAAAVLADRIRDGFTAGVETGAPEASFGDLPTPGPSVTVDVTEAGRMIVWMASSISVPATAGPDAISGRMSVELAGPTPQPAESWRALELETFHGSDTQHSMRACNIESYEGLAAGTYTVTAKYQAGPGVYFGVRRIVVMAF